MTPRELLGYVQRIPASMPIADTVVARQPHKPHWIGWLTEYDGPGGYNRKRHGRDARYLYNHLHCVGMMIWLAEGIGAPAHLVRQAAMVKDKSPPAEAARVRDILPWQMIERLLLSMRP